MPGTSWAGVGAVSSGTTSQASPKLTVYFTAACLMMRSRALQIAVRRRIWFQLPILPRGAFRAFSFRLILPVSFPGLTGQSSTHGRCLLDRQSKSDVSDFDHLIVPKSGRPDFGSSRAMTAWWDVNLIENRSKRELIGGATMSDGVRNNKAESRFELDVDGHTALAFYRMEPGVITFVHTQVPQELSGRRVGSRRLPSAFDPVRELGAHAVAKRP